MIKTRNIKGSTIVLALLVISLAIVICLGFLARRADQRRVVNSRLLFSQAQSIAWAGLEDARVKLMKSANFPPGGAGTHNFSYNGTVTDETGATAGTYFVQIEVGRTAATIFSQGRLEGEDVPRVSLRGLIDVSDERTTYLLDGSEATENRPFRWLRVEVLNV